MCYFLVLKFSLSLYNFFHNRGIEQREVSIASYGSLFLIKSPSVQQYYFPEIQIGFYKNI